MPIEIDTAAVEKALQDMHDKIAHFKRVDLGAELSAWQIEDLHRHRPFTMRFRAAGKAVTKVRPHSLLEMLKSEGVGLTLKEQRHYLRAVRKNLKRPIRHKRHKALVYRQHRHWSMRPILRQVLGDELHGRMRQMMLEKLTW